MERPYGLRDRNCARVIKRRKLNRSFVRSFNASAARLILLYDTEALHLLEERPMGGNIRWARA